MKRIAGYALFFVLGVLFAYLYNDYLDARKHAAHDISSMSESLIYQSVLLETYSEHCDIEGYKEWREHFKGSIGTYNFRIAIGEDFPFVDSPEYFNEHRERSKGYSNNLVKFDAKIERCHQAFNKSINFAPPAPDS
ncbi:hypothetical protein OOT55_14310 [Marinimicrobium sp. C6131]|uniref:hypothetical protein n=1 Tax=Marinimicrobium sp. C6131 TaxID=3022676 RepID=UPI00223E7BEE|nr:hypothetical protein [Marinimicrobium sp. C6131]UZJ43821.1 hypothetical protein OOT55_14310 [Marinimicrobium sp. C6131]